MKKRKTQQSSLSQEITIHSLLAEWVKLATYETEYAGRMETACLGCDRFMESGKIEHREDCLWVRSKNVLDENSKVGG